MGWLEKRQLRLEERFTRAEEEFREDGRLILAAVHCFGVITEEAFREALKYIVEEILGVAKVERWTYRDEDGFVYGYPLMVYGDVVVRDEVHILVEVKSRVSEGDVAELNRKARLYEKVTGIEPKFLIIGGLMDSNAWEAARRLNVELRPIISA